MIETRASIDRRISYRENGEWWSRGLKREKPPEPPNTEWTDPLSIVSDALRACVREVRRALGWP